MPLLALVLSLALPTALTAAYRLGWLRVTQALAGATPGDGFAHLIPLMEGLPWWLHALTVSAAALYAYTVVRLLARAPVPWVPVVLALMVEAASSLLSGPLIEAIGVRANPNPPLLMTVVSWALPIAAALYLRKMRRRPIVVE